MAIVVVGRIAATEGMDAIGTSPIPHHPYSFHSSSRFLVRGPLPFALLAMASLTTRTKLFFSSFEQMDSAKFNLRGLESQTSLGHLDDNRRV